MLEYMFLWKSIWKYKEILLSNKYMYVVCLNSFGNETHEWHYWFGTTKEKRRMIYPRPYDQYLQLSPEVDH